MTVQTSSGNNKRIAKNTLLLYFRMIFMMAVSLYTSRVVLNTLGVEDFGIYNVIGGVVAMFSVISGGLSAAISRYITFELGQGNTAKLKSVFSSSVTIQIGLALLIFVLAEIGGVWFLNEKMNLPESRIGAANWVLQCSILTFMVNLISVPYNAAIIAHERMQAFFIRQVKIVRYITTGRRLCHPDRLRHLLQAKFQRVHISFYIQQSPSERNDGICRLEFHRGFCGGFAGSGGQ